MLLQSALTYTCSITATAFNPMTGEIVTKKYNPSPAELEEGTSSFESPKTVYESGVTGFYLAKALCALGIDCAVGAVSRMQKSAKNKRIKNDKAGVEKLARLLAAHNIVETFMPDGEAEALRNITRALEDARDASLVQIQCLAKYLLTYGYIFDERNESGARKVNWTRARWAWRRNELGFPRWQRRRSSATT